MELPKNVTQIGEADLHCKIYVEDYCVSYLRQMNHLAENKPIGIALYGKRREEGDTAYLFLYGACKLDFLVREVRHLSQAQNQEVEKLRKLHFPDDQFLGYSILNGEMVEGFHVCEQGICRYIKGYACFYEKNDAMLAYMLDSRGTDAEPERVDEEKYEMVKQRQQNRKKEYQSRMGRSGGGMVQEGSEHREAEEDQENLRPQDAQDVPDGPGKTGREEERIPDIRRREAAGSVGQASAARSRWRENLRQGGWRKGAAQRAAEKRASEREGTSSGRNSSGSGSLQLMRLSVAGVFLLLLVAGIATLNNHGGVENLQNAAKHLLAEMTEQKLPDSSEEVLAAMNPQATQETLYAVEDLTEALQKENQEPGAQTASGQASEQTPDQTEGTAPEGAAPQEGEQLPAEGSALAEGERAPEQGSSAQEGAQPSEQGAAASEGEQLPAEGSAVSEGAQLQEQDSAISGGAQPPESGSAASGTAAPEGEGMPEQGAAAQEGTQPPDSGAAPEGEAPSQESSSPGGAEQSEGVQGASSGENGGSPASEEAVSNSEPISYTIQKGDTLIGISRAHYGTEAMVPEICALNNIANPDDIYFGQKILLP